MNEVVTKYEFGGKNVQRCRNEADQKYYCEQLVYFRSILFLQEHYLTYMCNLTFYLCFR